MSVHFRCPVCTQMHTSRLRARDAEQLSLSMQAFGSILEQCPAAGVWVRVEAADLAWAGRARGPAAV